ncbi:sensor histidine kinase [Aeromicrobium terrae]|uniref:histidine kinase n=1 Tax=Aeromicrobium terrae TaxID=2498846 RepID=A0A5C8NI55_9ACTN|nr:histidine kinase [Aeromicrobium terrae]TXL61439.1 sensor histidine kinase [Aeromicrobium terrae]
MFHRFSLVPIVVGAAGLVLVQLAADLTTDATTTETVLDVVGAVAGIAALSRVNRRPVLALTVLAAAALIAPAATPAACTGYVWLASTAALRPALALGLAGVAAHVVRGAWRPTSDGLPFGWWVVLVVLAYGLILGWGRYAQARERLLSAVAADARADERSRIAREMHDVLAHRLSLVATAAGALEYRPDSSPERIAAAAGVVRDGVHQALDELRDVIGVLRAEDAIAGAVPPQPTGADLPRLVEESRAAGTDVTATVEADLAALPDSLGRAAYRVVQEALTNVRRHAPGAAVDLRVTGRPGERLAIEVRNPLTTVAGASPGSGTGLIGLAERVDLAGGTMDVDRGNGEFHLRVSLPWPL